MAIDSYRFAAPSFFVFTNALTIAVASLKEIRISTWPVFLPIKTEFFWSISKVFLSDEVIVRYGDFVRLALLSAPSRPMTVYGCISPTVSITGVRGSSQTAFQLIPAAAIPMNREIHAMRCRSLCIVINPPPVQESIAHSFRCQGWQI